MTASASAEPSAAWRRARESSAAGPHFGDAWIAYRAAQGLRPLYLTLSGAGSEAGAATDAAAAGVAYLARPRLRFWKRWNAQLDLLPRATRADASATEFARAVIELARRSGWARLEIESFDGAAPPADLAALGCATRERCEFLLDLAPPLETRFSLLKPSHRRKVRDAEKAGVTVADETGADSVLLLRELQGHTKERRSDRGEEMALPQEAHYRRLAATFVALGGARLFVGRKDGRPLSAILCGVERRRAYYFMGGTSPEGFECNAATLVLWRASALLRERGVAIFNLGGVPGSASEPGDPQHGLLRFKEGFGAARVDCRSGTWTRDGTA